LVEELHRQCIDAEIDFEILVFDDGSTFFQEENAKIQTLDYCEYCILTENIGRTAIRNQLAHKANFEHLLFLDADVRLISPNFITNYLKYCHPLNQVIFGGCDYRSDSYSQVNSLRYHYGKKREAGKSYKRNQQPLKHILSANFLISKKDFLALEIPNTNVYGMDIFFSYLLIKHQKTILHIDNPVWHCGLEENNVFLEKSLKSIQFRKEKWLHIQEISEYNSLLKTYKRLNFFPINSLLKKSFLLLEKPLKKCFLKPIPSLRAFDLYRLLYLFKSN